MKITQPGLVSCGSVKADAPSRLITECRTDDGVQREQPAGSLMHRHWSFSLGVHEIPQWGDRFVFQTIYFKQRLLAWTRLSTISTLSQQTKCSLSILNTGASWSDEVNFYTIYCVLSLSVLSLSLPLCKRAYITLAQNGFSLYNRKVKTGFECIK